jgi:hypothetical protein
MYKSDQDKSSRSLPARGFSSESTGSSSSGASGDPSRLGFLSPAKKGKRSVRHKEFDYLNSTSHSAPDTPISMSRLPRHASPGSEPIANDIKDKAIRSRLSALQHVMEPSLVTSPRRASRRSSLEMMAKASPRRASRRSSLEMMAQASPRGISRELVTPKPRTKIPFPNSVPLDVESPLSTCSVPLDLEQDTQTPSPKPKSHVGLLSPTPRRSGGRKKPRAPHISLDIALEKLRALDHDSIPKVSDKQKQHHKKQYEVPAIGFAEPSHQVNDGAFAA